MKSRAIRILAAALSTAILMTSTGFTALASDTGGSSVTAEEKFSNTDLDQSGTSKLKEPRSLSEVNNDVESLNLNSSDDHKAMIHTEEEQKEAKEHILKELTEQEKNGEITDEYFGEFLKDFLYPADMFGILSFFTEEDWEYVTSVLSDEQKAAWLLLMPNAFLSYMTTINENENQIIYEKVERAVNDYLQMYTEKLDDTDEEKIEDLVYSYLDSVASISEEGIKTVAEYEEYLTKDNEDLKNKLHILRNLELDENNNITDSAYATIMTMTLSIFGIQYENGDSENIVITEPQNEEKEQLTTEDTLKDNETGDQVDGTVNGNNEEETVVDSGIEFIDTTEDNTEYKYITSFAEIDMSVDAPYETVLVKETEFDTLVTQFPEALTAVDKTGAEEVIEATWSCEENPLESNNDTFRYELELPYNYRYTTALESDFESGTLFRPYIEVKIQRATIISRVASFFAASTLSTTNRVHLDATIEEDSTGWYVYLNAGNMQSGDTIKMPTWSTNTAWQDDLKWYTASKGSWVVDGRSFNYRAHINLKDHKDIGSYRTDFYYTPGGGSDTPLLRENGVNCNLCYNLQGPVLKGWDVLKFSDTRFVVFLNVDSPQTIDGLDFPTWTSNGGQDDLVWHKGTKGNYEFNGKQYNYRCAIGISDHKNETGDYNVHLYASICGQYPAVGGLGFEYDPETVVFEKNAFKITLFKDGTLTFAEGGGTGTASSTAANMIPNDIKEKIKRVRGYELSTAGFTFSDAYGLFQGCENLETVEADFSKMSSFQKVKDYSYMFEGCSALEVMPDNFTLNKGTTTLYAMFGNSGLKEYPKGLVLDNEAYTDTLTSVTGLFANTKIESLPETFALPNAVITANGMFSGSSLVKLPDAFTFDNCKSLKGLSTFVADTDLKELPWNLTIPKTVNDIQGFAARTNLESLPDGFTIKSNNCDTREAFYASDISVIPATFKMPESGNHSKMFYTSDPINTIILTTDPTTLNYDWATDNRTVTVPKTVNEWKIGYPNAEDVVARLDKNGNFSISGTGNTVTYGNPNKVPWRAYYSSIKTVTFGSDVEPTDISYWFYLCTNLTELNLSIPDSVKKGICAFSGCTNLKAIGKNFDLPNYASDPDSFGGLFAVPEKTQLQIYSDNTDFAEAYAKVAESENREVTGTVTLNWQNGTSTEKYSYIYGQGLVLPYDTASTETVDVVYKGGQNDVGWMNGKWQNGSTLGSTDHYLEMFTVSSPVDDREMEIIGRAFNNKSGWSEWKNEGKPLGVEAASNRLNAIQLDLTGTYADQYQIYYRIYTDAQGWGQWKSNGQVAGVETNTTGGNYIKMLQIKLEKTTDCLNPGYEFTGWYKEKDCINKVESISEDQTGDLTLYAGWKGKTYKLVYNLNNGENDPENPETFEVGSGFSVQDLNDPHREGWEFGGWYTDTYFQNRFTEIPDDQAADFNLYAEWINPTDYKITYHLDGGTNDARNPSVYNEGVPSKLYAPAKSGYYYDGWYLDKELTKKVTEVGTIGMTGDIDLYTSWKSVSSPLMTNYTLVNDSDGVSTFYIKVDGISSSTTMSAPTWATTDGQDDIIWGGMTKGTYVINGLTYNFKYTVKKSDHHNDYGPYNTHFYTNNSVCVGTCNGYMLGAGYGYKVGDRGDNCSNWTCVSPLYTYVTSGWTCYTKFMGPYADNCGVCARVGITAAMYYDSLTEYYASCSHLGDHLTGWNIQAHCSRNGGKAQNIDGQRSGNYSHVVYLCTDHRQGINYKVRFHSTSGSGTMPGQDMTYGTSSALIPNQFTKPGYVFAGWSLDREGTSVDFEDGEIVYNLTDKDGEVVDLYAVWKSDATVVYDANGGDIGKVDTVDIINTDKDTYTVKSNDELGFTNKSDIEFAGWSLERDGEPVFKENELPEDISMDKLYELIEQQEQIEVEIETQIPASGMNNGSYLFVNGSSALTAGDTTVSYTSKTGLIKQRFKVKNLSDDYFMIYYGTTEKTLTAGDNLSLEKWGSRDEQQWTYKNGVLISKSGYTLNGTPKKVTYGIEQGYYRFSGLAGKCVHVRGDGQLSIYSDNGDYQFQYYVKNLNNGYFSIYNIAYNYGRNGYWTVDNNSNASGAAIHAQKNYTGADGQMWSFVTVEDTGMFIESKLGTVLDVVNGNSADDTALQMHSGNGSAAQLWTPQRLNPLANGVYEISMNANKNSIIGVQNGSYAAASHLIIADEMVPDDGKYFRVTYIGSGYYRIDNIRNGMSWNIDHGYTTDGTNLNTYPWQGNGNNELFKFIENSDGSYDIYAGKIGTYVGTSGSTAAGTEVKMYKNRSAYTKWKLTPAGGTENAYKTLTLYAVWGNDEPPVLEAEDTWVFYEDIEKDGISEEKLLESAKAEDDKDGNISKDIEIVDYETIKLESKLPYDPTDPNTENFVKSIEVTYQVSDSYGNVVQLKKKLNIIYPYKPMENGYIRYVSEEYLHTVDENTNWGNVVYKAELENALDKLEEGNAENCVVPPITIEVSD